MTAYSQDAAKSVILSPEAQAATLWTFVHAKAPRFTPSEALEVVNGLGGIANLEASALARRLQKELKARRLALKYVNALKLAAQMLGHQSYHAPSVAAAAPPLLHLVSVFKSLNRPIVDWKEGIDQFCAFAEGDQEGGGLRVYQMSFTPTSVAMGMPFTTVVDEDGRPVPTLQLQWEPESTQLAAAVAGVETMRRRYEETGRALIDGLAAAQFCLHNPHPDANPHDPANSELVIIETTPGPSFGDEVARGDEVKCWAELQFLHPTDQSPTFTLDGANWVVNGTRYEWRLSTVRMAGATPSIVTRSLRVEESSKLFRRHRNAVTSGRYFGNEDQVKALPSVASAIQQVEIDHEQLRRHMSCEVADSLALGRRVSVEELVKLSQALKLQDPSVLVRKPKRSELKLLQDDEILRTFISRVHDVVCEVPRRLSDDLAAEVNKAIDSMLTGLKMDVVLANGEVHSAFPRTPPHMVYANQGREALRRMEELGLVVYAGIFTTVKEFRPQGVAERNIKSESSLRVEQVLYLDVDVADTAH